MLLKSRSQRYTKFARFRPQEEALSSPAWETQAIQTLGRDGDMPAPDVAPSALSRKQPKTIG